MTTTVQYIKTYTGIDISLPLNQQNTDKVENILGRQNKRQFPISTSAIYDGVVGIDRIQNRGFDRSSNHPELPSRLNASELRNLSEIANGIRKKNIKKEAAQLDELISNALEKIILAADSYHKLLTGEYSGIGKNAEGIESRHSLVRGDNGHIFEMQNTMTESDIYRFKRKTRMMIDAIEKPREISVKNGETFYKIELGSGAFGKARIARNICTDTYVAVKKIHPVLSLDFGKGFYVKSHDVSKFYYLPKEKQIALKNINHSVISPIDEISCYSNKSQKLRSVANEINNMSKRPIEDLVKKIRSSEEANKIFEEEDIDEISSIIASMVGIEIPVIREMEETHYSFSELGLTSIQAFISTLNVLRCNFEGLKTIDALTEPAKKLLESYAESYYEVSADIAAQNQTNNIFLNLGLLRFEEDNFKIKDVLHNQRFLNTIAKKMLYALSQLHDCGELSHRDIKPDNIVLSQNYSGEISVKLIDLDLIEINFKDRKLPSSGCIAYMPPEAFLRESDNSISYIGEKADAYAMGLSLRSVYGFSTKEIIKTGEFQKIKAMIEKLPQSKENRKNPNFRVHMHQLQLKLDGSKLSESDQVQNQLWVMALMDTVPDAICVKDIADLMIKNHPGKRFTPSKTLKLKFFHEEKNFLSDEEFSDHTKRIMRFGKIISQEELHELNDLKETSLEHLKAMRNKSIRALQLHRGIDVSLTTTSTLSVAEKKSVDKKELVLQTTALFRRGVRTVSEGVKPAQSHGDKIHQYKKR